MSAVTDVADLAGGSTVRATARLAGAMLTPLRWFLLLWAVAGVLAVGAAAASGATVWAALAGTLLLHAGVGLLGSFLLHEAAHLVALRALAPGVRAIDVQITPLRASLVPRGRITGHQSALVAVAGPGACVATGAVLAAVPADAGLAFWFLAHAVFLLPVFGDGRALLTGLRRGRRPVGGP